MTPNQILNDIYAMALLMESREPVTVRRDYLACLKTFPMTDKANRYIEDIMYHSALFPRHKEIKIGTPYFFLENTYGYLCTESDLMLLQPDIYEEGALFKVYMLRIDTDPERGHVLRLWKMSPAKLEKDKEGWVSVRQPERKESPNE